jgi:DNA-binding transcriptional regulator GbsR (MarR family)
MTEQQTKALTPNMEKFVTSWGAIASKCSVNRTVAEVHAFFFLTAEPLNADEIVRALAFSRSNVSASLRELESRGLISSVHVHGDRKQYYAATKDLWEAFRVIVDDHKRRVFDPNVAVLRACLEEQTRTTPEDSYTLGRMRETVSFFDAINSLLNELLRLPKSPSQNLFSVTAKAREGLGKSVISADEGFMARS